MAGLRVARALQERQAHERLDAAHEGTPGFQCILVVKRDGFDGLAGRFCEWGIHVAGTRQWMLSGQRRRRRRPVEAGSAFGPSFRKWHAKSLAKRGQFLRDYGGQRHAMLSRFALDGIATHAGQPRIGAG